MCVELDCRGLACPQPVINTKKQLAQEPCELFTVLVDNEAAKENVSKFALSQGCGLCVEQQDSDYRITITKNPSKQASDSIVNQQSRQHMPQDTVILFSQNTLGHGNDELGTVLMKSWMYALTQSDTPPHTLLFINSGIFLTVEESPVLEHLKVLAERGVKILSCGTCLDFYHLKDQLAIGSITNMYEIMEQLTMAEKAVTL